MVKVLVASGAEVDCKDKKAYTPLHAAASSGMSSTVHYLLSLGVPVSTYVYKRNVYIKNTKKDVAQDLKQTLSPHIEHK